LDYCDDTDAMTAWRELRRTYTVDPRPKSDVLWTGGLWTSDDEHHLVALTGHC